MNKIILFLAFACVFCACDNTLDLVEEGADISIVYSLLSASTDRQIVRLERGFIDAEQAATVIAQDASRVYYDDAVVTLRNLTSGESYDLPRIEGTSIGKTRDDGFFLTDPNYIYSYNGDPTDFQFNDEVVLEIQKDEGSDPITASIQLLDDLLVISPKSGSDSNFPSDTKFKVQWVKSTENAGIEYSVAMRLHYSEADLSDEEPEFEEKVLDWNFATVKDQEFAELAGIEFYKLFGNNLEKNETLVREFLSYDVIITYSGKEMNKFQNFLNANTGITSSQPIPPYTNLSSGLGLVAESEVKIIDNIFIGTATKDSLRMGRFTKDLNFQ